MYSTIKQSAENNLLLRVTTGSGIEISGTTPAECVENYVAQRVKDLRSDITQAHARIMNARMQIAELMQAIEDSENEITTARQLIGDLRTWLDWQTLSPEEYLHCLTTPVPF